jgi:hypothetical protein
MKHFHLIEAKYLGATNSRGSKVKLTSLRFPNDSFTVSWDYEYSSNLLDQAQVSLNNIGIKVSGYGYDEKKGTYILATETFEPIKQMKNMRGLSESGRAKDMRYYNAQQKHERAYLPKRKTVRTYAKKKR